MIPLFQGLTFANLLLLTVVFILGLATTDAQHRPTSLYVYHIGLAIAAGLMTSLVHLSVFTYFMATAKWLGAATEKADFDPAEYVTPALARKRRAFLFAMAAVGTTILAMFAGAGADPSYNPWWPAEVHLALASVAVAANLIAALGEYPLIRDQGKLMDHALTALNKTPGLSVTIE